MFNPKKLKESLDVIREVEEVVIEEGIFDWYAQFLLNEEQGMNFKFGHAEVSHGDLVEVATAEPETRL